MKKYSVKIEAEALSDIQSITDWYNETLTTEILAVISTSQNPKIWEEKTYKK